MKLTGEIVRNAHHMTKRIKGSYPEVDYRAQLGLCLSYIIREESAVDVESLIKKCDIVERKEDGALLLRNPRQELVPEVKAKKQEILAYLRKKEADEKAARDAWQEKIDSIEGLKEIERAQMDEERYSRQFNRMMDDEFNDGARPPRRPKANSIELRRRYPRAAAYLKAESWEYASNYAKASAGKKALERIINGEDYSKVLEDMDAEWSAHCARRAWD